MKTIAKMNNPFTNSSLEGIKDIVNTLVIRSDELTYRKILSLLDLTSLNITDTESSISDMVEKVNNFGFLFPDLKNVAAICVYPRFIPVVKDRLSDREVKIASVGGCFPSSQSFTSIKADECRLATEAGADEIDMVLSVGDFIAGNKSYVTGEIMAIRKAAGKAHLKVILETGLMEKPSDIYDASMLAMKAGADFIKSSTGKSPVSATPEAAWVMCTAARDFFNETGKRVGFKPAGGISTAPEAALYFSIVETILGKEWLTSEYFRIGASRLANNLLSSIEGRDVYYF